MDEDIKGHLRDFSEAHREILSWMRFFGIVSIISIMGWLLMALQIM